MKKLFYFILSTGLLTLTGCEEVIFEQDISGDSVSLVAPLDGTQVTGTNVQFNWRSVEGASSYEVQVATPDFANASQIVASTVTDSTFFQAQLAINTYEWRVKALNSGYETTYSAAGFSVVDVTDFSNNVVVLLSPQENAISNEDQLTFQWEAIEGATQYRIQLLEGQVVQNEQTTAGTSFLLTPPEGEIQWQVRAENDTQSTLYTTRSALIDRTDPNVPAPVSPVDEAVLTSQDVSFSWTRETIAGSVEFDSLYVYRDLALTDLVLKEEVQSPFETTLSNDTYYWLLKAFDEAGNESNDSTVFSFTVQ